MVQTDGKREYVRINDEFSVRLVRRDDPTRKGTLEVNTSKSINVSGNGILLNMKDKLDVGTVVNITFMKPNTFDFFNGRGRVVHIEEDEDKTYNVGIHFIDLTPEDMNVLDYYIKLGEKQGR